ncbi:MAG: hypothetical protein Q9O62_09910 [Ardenticatenia bacterium]|nr:hypothetical protein [Ardenticatenia bacterium]
MDILNEPPHRSNGDPPSTAVPAWSSAGATAQMWGRRAVKVTTFFASLFLFVLGIVVMKDGASVLTPLVERLIDLSRPLRGLSAGWLSSMIIMSGSPVAAAALAFLDAGLLSPISAYMMITGSRFGASFIVLCLGLMYALRGRDLMTSVGMGLLSFGITISLHVLGLVPGIWLLTSGVLQSWSRPRGAAITSLVEHTFQPIRVAMMSALPSWSLFGVGFLIIMLSFALFDRCLPTESLKQSRVGKMSRYVYRPWVMFLLGALLTLISMSVSLSISILVPLNDRGLVRRENVIPYIMGANITTFVDTLLAAMLLSPRAFEVVLAEMLSVALPSLAILLFAFRQYEYVMEAFVEWVSRHPKHLFLFLFALFAIPLAGLIL